MDSQVCLANGCFEREIQLLKLLAQIGQDISNQSSFPSWILSDRSGNAQLKIQLQAIGISTEIPQPAIEI